MKILHCRDAGFDCDAVVEGTTVEDVLEQVRPHAKEVHDLVVDEPVEQQLRELVRDASSELPTAKPAPGFWQPEAAAGGGLQLSKRGEAQRG
ncbi:MAG TPA: DUF1059 domain-containing protein [Acidimicrobiales bacterium]|nr:DUF1059 domain-containing protein [Acidimicrobiales bacterium]